MKAKKFCHRVVRYGPGGWTCPCCGPAPRQRRKARQQARRVLARFIDKIEDRESVDDRSPEYWTRYADDDEHRREQSRWWREWKTKVLGEGL